MDIVTLVANTGGVLGLAIFAIFLLNKVWSDRLAEEKRNTETICQMWDITLKALNSNTMAITELKQRLEKERSNSKEE